MNHNFAIMELQAEMDIGNVSLERLDDDHVENIRLHVLRLDKIHPVVGGNKWFKLKYYLQEAVARNHKCIATFGGAFSNHILATAYASNKQGIACKGFIRGEKPRQLSPTLRDAEALNMRIEFISRSEYSDNTTIINKDPSVFFIPEGGYGKTGAKGAAEILQLVPNLSLFSHVVCAVGTGTMLAGIVNASLSHQRCIGVSVMKNNYSLENEIRALVNDETRQRITLLHDYHFGGYAKYTDSLIGFMNRMWSVHQLPLDFVYTAKALYAVYQLEEERYFPAGSNVLFIHSGGLQGNRSLNKQTLSFLDAS